MTCGEEDTASCLPNSNDMTSSRCTQNTVLTDEQFLDTICSTDLCNQLDNLWVPVSAITTNYKERTLNTFRNRKENGGDKGFAIVILLEDSDLLAQTGCAWSMHVGLVH